MDSHRKYPHDYVYHIYIKIKVLVEKITTRYPFDDRKHMIGHKTLRRYH